MNHIQTYVLGPIPPQTTSLVIERPELRTISQRLPQFLRRLECSYIGLGELPALPATLEILIVKKNRLQWLPPLPGALRTLIGDDNRLRCLPELPDGLRKLTVSGNLLTRLPPLPGTLLKLLCCHNRLEWLPPFPSQLRKLRCLRNRLTHLPPFPRSLKVLDCASNEISFLPKMLPYTLRHLSLTDNPLEVLPILPSSLTYFRLGEGLPPIRGYVPPQRSVLILWFWNGLRVLWTLIAFQFGWRAMRRRRDHANLYMFCMEELRCNPFVRGVGYRRAMKRLEQNFK